MKTASHLGSRNGSALISTMLVLTVLTIIVIAFLQSMTVEQKTARSYANKYRAELAAESALSLAMGKILEAASENCVVGLDQSQPEEQQPITIARLDDKTGGVLSTTPIAIDPTSAHPGRTHRFQITSSLIRESGLYPIKQTSGELQSLAAFYVQPNTSKETLFRFPSVDRQFATTIQEVPLVKPDRSTYSQGQVDEIDAFVGAHPTTDAVNWKTLTFTPETFNQFTKGTLEVTENWTDVENWSPAKSRLGEKKINLRRLKYYVDGLANGQGQNNPKSKVVDALLDLTSEPDPEASWGGGTLKWLTDSNNPDRYTTTEAKQIAADLIDYLDADLHPTTDNIENPTYLGVEGRLESDGTVTGHPYIASIGGGLVFNVSSSPPGALNSTRDLICWTLVNPWSHETLAFAGTYSAELNVEVQGTASGGTLGNDARNYFGQANKSKPGELNERLTELSPALSGGKLKPYAGATFPAEPSGMSYADFYSMFNESKQQPPKMVFNNLSLKLKKARLKFTDTNGQTSYVQVIATESNPLELQLNPKNINIQSGSGSQVLNPATVNRFAYLKTDPRLSFRPDSFTKGDSASTFAGAKPPKNSGVPDITGLVTAAEWDGGQGMLTTSEWYSTPEISKHFFNRSPAKLEKNPKDTAYDPKDNAGAVAVDTIGEMGYLFTGRPWQTLRMVAKDAGTREDYTLLDFLDSGTMESASDKNVTPNFQNINGKINVNTAPDYVLRSLFEDMPGMKPEKIDALVQGIVNRRKTKGPFVGAGDFGELTLFDLEETDKFKRENVLRRMANLTTTRTNEFTIYAYGEACNAQSKPVANASLTAVVQLYHDASGTLRIQLLRKTWN